MEADRGELNISYQVTADLPRNRHYVQADAIRQQLRDRLLAEGLDGGQITTSPLTFRSEQHYPDDAPPIEINKRFTGTFRVVSSDLDQIDALMAVIEATIGGGDRDRGTVQDLQLYRAQRHQDRHAARGDRQRAARRRRVRQGRRRPPSAASRPRPQGGFSIRDASNDRSETEERVKRVRVVTTITFYMDM